jgi:protein TonB
MVKQFFSSLLLFSLGCVGSVAAQRSASPGLVAASATTAGKSSPAAPTAAAPLFKADSIFVNPDVRPQFVGGETGLQNYLMKGLHYPEIARRQHVTGKVLVRFILSASGNVTDASVVRGPGSGLNEEALRLVWLMPAWQPAKQRGQPVRVVCTMPINFEE